jgi:hypothetical protein
MFEWGVRTMGCNLSYGCKDGAVSSIILWDLALRPQKLGKYRGTFEFFKCGSHSLKNRKSESQNVYQHVADGHSHPILSFSWVAIQSCTNFKFVKHNERGRGKGDG